MNTAVRARRRIAAVEERLEKLLCERPEAKIVRSMPGMGAVFTAEFLAEVGDLSRFASADALAAAAGLVPVTRASGNSSFQRRAKRGNRPLKHLMFWSAFRCVARHKPSKDFYVRKRGEGKTHHQATIALARKRVNVLWAMLRDGELYRERSPAAAWLKDRDAVPSSRARFRVAAGPNRDIHGVDRGTARLCVIQRVSTEQVLQARFVGAPHAERGIEATPAAPMDGRQAQVRGEGTGPALSRASVSSKRASARRSKHW